MFMKIDKIRSNFTVTLLNTSLLSFYSLLRYLLVATVSAEHPSRENQSKSCLKKHKDEYPLSLRWPCSACVCERASYENSVFRLIKNFILCTIYFIRKQTSVFVKGKSGSLYTKKKDKSPSAKLTVNLLRSCQCLRPILGTLDILFWYSIRKMSIGYFQLWVHVITVFPSIF